MMNEKTSNEDLYQERLDRIRKVIRLEPVDRIPVVYMGSAFAPRFAGMKLADFVNDPEAGVTTTLALMDRIKGFDGVNSVMAGKMSAGAPGMGRLKMPGRELPEDTLWQVEETEIMTIEDYDLIIEKGFNVFEAKITPMTVHDMGEVQKNMAWVMANNERLCEEFRKQGYVIISGRASPVPLEIFALLRSTPQFMYDLYRRPDKVKAAMDAAMPDLIQKTLGMQKMMPRLGAWCGGWRGAPNFLNPKLWDEFFFSYFKQIAQTLLDLGVVPVLHLDQDWTSALERLRELPAKTCLLNPDGMTDLRKFKKVLGDHMAVMGDIPASLFTLGTPEKIRAYVRDLINDVGPTGLILCPGCDAPVTTKPENMEAFVEAAHEFGTFRFGD
jgi:uroporphyrinogen-III decarboxylase